MIWSGSLSNTYDTDYILELSYKFCKREDGSVVRHTMTESRGRKAS
jgi:hypothetical protein